MCYKLRWGIYLDSGRWILLSPVLLFLKKKEKETVLVILQRKKDKNIMNFKPTVWLLLFPERGITWDGNKGQYQMPPRIRGAPNQPAMGAQIWFPEEKCGDTHLMFPFVFFSQKNWTRAGYWDGKHEIVGLQTVHCLAFRKISEEGESTICWKLTLTRGQLQPLEQVWKRLSWVLL